MENTQFFAVSLAALLLCSDRLSCQGRWRHDTFHLRRCLKGALVSVMKRASVSTKGQSWETIYARANMVGDLARSYCKKNYSPALVSTVAGITSWVLLVCETCKERSALPPWSLQSQESQIGSTLQRRRRM